MILTPGTSSVKTGSWSGISGAASALLFLELVQKLARPVLVVCSTNEEAKRYQEDFEFFQSAFEKDPKNNVQYLPGWEQSPYRRFSPSALERCQRILLLYQTSKKQNSHSVIFCSITTLLQRAPNPQHLGLSLEIQKTQAVDLTKLPEELKKLGYSKKDVAEAPGDFAVRGGILDIFSPSYPHPARLDFFDTQIESMRFYNAETQRSIHHFHAGDKLLIPPVREFACDASSFELAKASIKAWCDNNDIPKSARDRTSDLLSQGIAPPEFDYLLPFFQKEPSYIWEYFKDFFSVLIEPEVAHENWRGFWEKQSELYEEQKEKLQICASRDELYNSSGFDFFLGKKPDHSLRVRSVSLNPEEESQLFLEQKPQAASLTKENHLSFDRLKKEVRWLQDSGHQVYFVANSQSQIDRISFLLAEHGIKNIFLAKGLADSIGEKEAKDFVFLLNGAISKSFLLPEKKCCFYSEDDLFGKKTHRKKSAPHQNNQILQQHIQSFSVDDLVVHLEHGIARFKGLVHLKSSGIEGDFAHLEYAGNDKLYLPIYRLDLLQKYVGSNGSNDAALDKLGSQLFEKKKEKVKNAVRDIAQKLIKIYAERSLLKGYKFSEPDENFHEFEAEFPFDETPDQLKAIEQTIDDMCSSKPMDRLVCGDVGFGKTEVAIRAAYKAVQDGKQVAVLVPTTILAEQHYQTFTNRLKNHPVRMASLSRFKTKKEQNKILADLAEAKVDIIIGTHRLLSKDVLFRDLGLLVIDEEQRFGVEHKEKLKLIKASTDVLTLTATPIPRTLHMSLMGLRDISIIRTPPSDRMSIKTILAAYDKGLIREAIENELSRGGQIFFIHNRVQSIYEIADDLKKIVPRVKIGVAHGQMNESELEKVMLGFYQKDFDLLLATTIIENGLDVPNANTIIVNRADTFGLSQLYQIRGRVGRSQVKAYAYLLAPEDAAITQDARERLAVLQKFVELGSGFAIASHDLELRGGGSILGEEQSGHISDVGYDLYLELLEEEVHRLKGETANSREKEDVEIHAPFPALLPEAYVPDMRSRLLLYKRLSNLKTEEELESAQAELEDRYGKAPFETVELFWLLRVKILLRRMGFNSITIGKKGFTVSGSQPKIDLGKLLRYMNSQPGGFILNPEGKLTVQGEFLSLKSVNDELRNMLAHIGSL